jgi:7-carboxy-7-deazaguanine synthase
MTTAAPARATPVRPRTYPVIEIFGPTIQGEGSEAGLATHFLRVGGCDYRCSWCDTMYAVDPATVRAKARPLTSDEIVDEIAALGAGPHWVTISGGNPALHDLGPVVDRLRQAGFLVGVETQGSRWRDWLADVDRLTISPKPPSSGMASPENEAQLRRFMEHALPGAGQRSVLKIVCFDDADLAWAAQIAGRYRELPVYLSAGTPVPAPQHLRDAVGETYRWLCERAVEMPELARARVLPQLHVIAWKDATGV